MITPPCFDRATYEGILFSHYYLMKECLNSAHLFGKMHNKGVCRYFFKEDQDEKHQICYDNTILISKNYRVIKVTDSEKESVIDVEYKLRKISGLIKQKGRKILANYPITSSQFVALQWIIEEEALTIGDLSKKIGLAFSTTTDLVDRMEKNGLVERVKDVKDRRVVRVHVLEKGASIIKEVIEKRQEYLGEILKNFTEDERTELMKWLGLLYTQMEKVDIK